MLKEYRVMIVLILLSVILSTPALAGKVLVVPTAEVLPKGLLQVDYVYHRGVSSLHLGLGFYPGLSAGVRQDFGGQLSFGLKAAIIEETEKLPGFALGGDLGLGKQHIYATLSKQLGIPGLRGHATFGTGRYSRGMAGVTFMLNPAKVRNVPTTSLFAEYDGQGLNAGVIAQFSPELRANLALAAGHGLSFGLNYKVAF